MRISITEHLEFAELAGPDLALVRSKYSNAILKKYFRCVDFAAKLTLNDFVETILAEGIEMDRIEITADDFIVTIPHGREAGQDLVTDADDVDVVEKWQANSAIIEERSSPAAVAGALVELLQYHPIPEEELDALRWLRDQLHQTA